MADIPKSLRDIEQAIGTSKTLELIEKFGGQKIYIPVTMTGLWSLLPILGEELSKKLIGVCGGSQVEIPRGTNHKRSVRNAAIRRDRAIGLSLAQLTQKYDLSRRRITAIINTKISL